MQYFIPAWYGQDGWTENEQAWYRARTITEFDDTVKQVQLFFRRHVAPFEILLLSYSPNFRHFLHRQGVYHAPWWSCFDAMQCVRARAMQTFSFYDLAWPEGVEFIYSPFAVLAMRGGEKFAQIEFAEDGNMFLVDLFHGGQLVSRNLYDDRGFVSSQIAYKDGTAAHQRFFDEEGTWKFAEYFSDGHVVINPKSAWYLRGTGNNAEKVPYRQQRYSSLDNVIEEVLSDFLATTSMHDAFTVAMHPRHSEVLSRALAGRSTVLSFFGRRLGLGNFTDVDGKLLDFASCAVADKKSTAIIVKGLMRAKTVPVKVITPYEARVEFGVSQRLHVQNILIAADALYDRQFDAVIASLAKYICEKNHLARVCLFTRSSQYDERVRLLQRAQAALQKVGMNPEMAGAGQGVSENEPTDGTTPHDAFTVRQCVDELHVSRTMSEQRVVVDLSSQPDQFLQISAMSMGIPQITMRKTEYVADGKNGKVLRDVSQLPDAVDFYLSSVEHFNEAQIASYDLGSQFTSGELVKAWKEVIQIVQH